MILNHKKKRNGNETRNKNLKISWLASTTIAVLLVAVVLFSYIKIGGESVGKAYSIRTINYPVEIITNPCINGGCDVDPTRIYSFGFEAQDADDFTFTKSTGTIANF